VHTITNGDADHNIAWCWAGVIGQYAGSHAAETPICGGSTVLSAA